MRLKTILTRQRGSSKQNRFSAKPDPEGGYTLTELLVVLAIISLLVALVAPQMLGRVGKARSETALAQIENLLSALELYQLDTGGYPTEEQGLEALVTPPEAVEFWSGPYLRGGALPEDPWNQPFVYRREGNRVEVVSLGRDGAPGGEGADADISKHLIELEF